MALLAHGWAVATARQPFTAAAGRKRAERGRVG
jgi:hypothetical protein